jgi:hypothetical protein
MRIFSETFSSLYTSNGGCHMEGRFPEITSHLSLFFLVVFPPQGSGRLRSDGNLVCSSMQAVLSWACIRPEAEETN